MRQGLRLRPLLAVALIGVPAWLAPSADAQQTKAKPAAPPAQAAANPPPVHDEGTLEVTSDRDLEWLQQDKPHALQIGSIRQGSIRALIYCVLILAILTFGPTKNADFIYLNF